MKRIFRTTIIADKYPMEYTVEASNWATAVARGVREWAKSKGKGSRTDKLSIRIFKSGPLLKEDNGE